MGHHTQNEHRLKQAYFRKTNRIQACTTFSSSRMFDTPFFVEIPNVVAHGSLTHRLLLLARVVRCAGGRRV